MVHQSYYFFIFQEMSAQTCPKLPFWWRKWCRCPPSNAIFRPDGVWFCLKPLSSSLQCSWGSDKNVHLHRCHFQTRLLHKEWYFNLLISCLRYSLCHRLGPQVHHHPSASLSTLPSDVPSTTEPSAKPFPTPLQMSTRELMLSYLPCYTTALSYDGLVPEKSWEGRYHRQHYHGCVSRLLISCFSG